MFSFALAAAPAFAATPCTPGDTMCPNLPETARPAWKRAQDMRTAKTGANPEGAIAEYQHVYELAPANVRVLILYYMALCEKQAGHYARASEVFERELREGGSALSAAERSDIEKALKTLKEYYTTVEIIANEPGATLLVDGREVGMSPFASPVRVDAGKRLLTLRKEGFKDETTEIQFNPGKPARYSFRLEQLVKMSSVLISVTGAPSAAIFIDGKEESEHANATSRGYTVTAGKHTFEARAENFTTSRQTLDVKFGEKLSIVLSLSAQRREGKVTITAEPAGALIEIDGRVVGQTMWEGILATGGHQLIFKKTGYDPVTQELVVQNDQVRKVNVTLLETRSNSWIWWTIGTVAVVGAGTAVSYYVFKPNNGSPYTGTFTNGLVTGSFR